MPRKKKALLEKDLGEKLTKEKTETVGENKEMEEKDKEREVSALKERAKELEAGLEKEEMKIEELEKEIKKQQKLLFPLEEYVKAGIHLGTKIISGDMRKYVYRRRADGLAILNTNLIDEKLREAIKLISKFKPEDIILVCKREAGWKAAGLFSELAGIRAFTKKYPAGIITNPNLSDFFEPSLVIISDPWIDKNAIHDAKIRNIPVIGLCDSNNVTRAIDCIIPCNNKSNKTLGLVFYILAEGYCKARGIKFEAKISDFTGEDTATENQNNVGNIPK
jgi:small subunit ribosomal protein S2